MLAVSRNKCVALCSSGAHTLRSPLPLLTTSRFVCRTTRVGTQHVSLAPLLGCPFGATFQVVDGRLVWIAVREDGGAVDLEADERSNKQLVDDGTAQVCGTHPLCGRLCVH